MSEMMNFSGNANRELALAVSDNLGLNIGKATVSKFSDGEINVEIHEHVRGKDIFIIQPICAPANDNLMELMVMADALRRASAVRLTAVIPYFGYARQDKRVRSARVPITAKIIADMLDQVGFSRVLTVDLHADQIQGFFNIPVDNVYATPEFLNDITRKNYPNIKVVSPDIGGVIRARAVAKRLDSDLAIIDKRRPQPNEAQVMNVIGDVKNRTCIIIDDIIDTAGTLCAASAKLKEQGASKVIAYITHPVLSGKAIVTIENSQLDELVVTNTILLNEKAQRCKLIRQLSLSDMLSEAIRRVSVDESVSSMFPD